MDDPGTRPLLSSLRKPLRAIGSVVLPSAPALDVEGWQEAETIIEDALAPRPASIKRQLRLFLRVVNLLPVFSTGRTLVGLPQERRAAFLLRLQRSRLLPLRRGMWGIRTLLFMGYYNQDRVRREMGYRADPGGWGARRGGETPEGRADGQEDPGEKPRQERQNGAPGGSEGDEFLSDDGSPDPEAGA